MAKTCPACGKQVPSGKTYCNNQCFSDRPPGVVYAERMYGMPIQLLMLDFLNKNDNISITAQLLATSPSNLSRWIEKYNIERIKMPSGRGLWRRKRRDIYES